MIDDPPSLEADLPQLPGWRDVEATEIQARLRCRSAANTRQTTFAQCAVYPRQQRSKIRPKPGRCNDRVTGLTAPVHELDNPLFERVYVRAHGNRSVAYLLHRSDVEKWHPAGPCDAGQRAGLAGWKSQAA